MTIFIMQSHVYENQFVTSSACIVDIFYQKKLENVSSSFFRESNRVKEMWPSTVPGDSQRGLKRSLGLAWELELDEPDELPLPGRGCSFSTRSHRGRWSTLLWQGRIASFEGYFATRKMDVC